MTKFETYTVLSNLSQNQIVFHLYSQNGSIEYSHSLSQNIFTNAFASHILFPTSGCASNGK
ncbi:MAG: hypothetical protein Q8S84_02335 [bacterium]|nr:hypothetical protein [bacterium]